MPEVGRFHRLRAANAPHPPMTASRSISSVSDASLVAYLTDALEVIIEGGRAGSRPSCPGACEKRQIFPAQ